MESLKRREHRSGETAIGDLTGPSSSSSMPPPQTFGRYVLHAPIARGGMATVYLARLIGAEGFSRIVAAKRLHPQFTEDPDFVAMFHDEARIASRIHHPNVVPVLDVVLQGAEVILVQEYVHGVPLDKLLHASLLSEDAPIPVGISVAIITAVLAGLEAAHETRDEMGIPLSIVHRDVSPQNVLVSMDGIPRLLDFGIAKARSSAHVTREGFFKGKVAYMSPEQLRAEDVTRSADIYACGVLLWELLAHRRLHAGRGEAELFHAVLTGAIPTITAAVEGVGTAISEERWAMLRALEPIVSRALSIRAGMRFATANDMARAMLAACPAASSTELAEWVKIQGAEYLERRQAMIASSEENWRSHSRIAAVMAASVAPESMKIPKQRDALDPDAILSPPAVSQFAPVPMQEGSGSGIAPASPVTRFLPWIVAATLLLIVGVLLGVLGARGGTEPVNAAATSIAAPPAVAVTPPPTPAQAEAPSPDATVTMAPSRPSRGAPPAPAPAPVRAAPPPRSQLPAPHTLAPQHAAPQPAKPSPASAPQAASAPPPVASPPPSPPKTDCDPPFYFEGTKKVFKPSCL